MKKGILFVLIVCSFSVAAQEKEAFDAGKDFYKEGNYDKAIAKWEHLLDDGWHSAALYFNIGNAYYKQNEIAPSIYYYEKALQLAPNDKDIKNNLAFAENMTIDDIEPLPESVFAKWHKSIYGLFTADGWGWLTVVCFILFALLFLLYYFAVSSGKKRVLFSASMLALLVAITAIAMAYSVKSYSDNHREAIIFSEEAAVYSEPTSSGATSFLLHEGTKVTIIDEDDDWFRIELADGKDGWAQENTLKEL